MSRSYPVVYMLDLNHFHERGLSSCDLGVPLIFFIDP